MRRKKNVQHFNPNEFGIVKGFPALIKFGKDLINFHPIIMNVISDKYLPGSRPSIRMASGVDSAELVGAMRRKKSVISNIISMKYVPGSNPSILQEKSFNSKLLMQ